MSAMGEPEDRVSDAEREQQVASLRHDLLAGRLALEEFSDRVEIAYGAQVRHELARARDGLPETRSVAATRGRRKPTRATAALFSHVARRGRLRLRRRTVALSAFADIDLDLRDAELDSAEVTVTVIAAFGNVDVYVPEGITVTVGGLGVFGHQRDWGREVERPDAPVVRVRALSAFGTVDVWRVPTGMEGGYGEIVTALEEGRRELPA